MSEWLERAREHRAGLRTAIGRVERALSGPAGSGRAEPWSKELREELIDLTAALDLHIVTTEADDGLLADIVLADPRLAHRVELTKADHVALRQVSSAAIGLVDSVADDASVAAARDAVVELLTALVRHRHLGADLVYEAYNVDIEASD
ncbi:MAG: hypothetical protein QOF60_758 [Actinomycetota bacterium]|jgi:hypothetical protein|nr:hypothetical protein [Actinomycetota bacterium]